MLNENDLLIIQGYSSLEDENILKFVKGWQDCPFSELRNELQILYFAKMEIKLNQSQKIIFLKSESGIVIRVFLRIQ